MGDSSFLPPANTFFFNTQYNKDVSGRGYALSYMIVHKEIVKVSIVANHASLGGFTNTWEIIKLNNIKKKHNVFPG